jgi:hypothetical protein
MDKSEYKKQWYIKNRERIRLNAKIYYQLNKEDITNKSHQYYKSNRKSIIEKRKTYFEEYRKNNKEKIKEINKKYREENKEKVKEYNKNWLINNRHHVSSYTKRRKLNDTNFRLSVILRKRLNMAIKNNQKSGSAVSDLGCSIDYLRQYLEKKFLPGMKWENYGRLGWHIDHVIPLAYFDLSDPKQFKKACHYTNLQPLWAKDNISKGAKVLTGDMIPVSSFVVY